MLLLSKFKIHGHSMEPHIKNGQSVLISSVPYLFKNPQINDIVAIQVQDKILIKRIIRTEKEKYFVQGDNIKDSLDSRKFGNISKEKILGKMIYKI